MAQLAFELILRFLFGTTLALMFVRRQESSERFLRVAFWIALGTGACALLLLWALPLERSRFALTLAMLLSGFSLYALRAERWARIAGFVCILSSAFVFLRGLPAYHVTNFLLSAAVLGTVFAGQFLGHWFLNVPGMHIQELKRLTIGLWAAFGLRIIELGLGMNALIERQARTLVDTMGRPIGFDASFGDNLENLSLGLELFSFTGGGFLGLGSFGHLLVATRVLWGVLAPLVLSYMIHRTVALRATQSATGIYYALSVMVLVGEAVSLFLTVNLGVGM